MTKMLIATIGRRRLCRNLRAKLPFPAGCLAASEIEWKTGEMAGRYDNMDATDGDEGEGEGGNVEGVNQIEIAK
jgi:hypothetical protein